MAANMVLLEKITVGAAGASSVTFSGIPQTGYTDLVVRMSTRSDRGSSSSPSRLYPNGSSTSITLKSIVGSGSAASSLDQTAFSAFIGETSAASSTASTFGSFDIYIPNYTSSNYKSVSIDSVAENNASLTYAVLTAFLWPSSAAITSLQILDGLGNFVQYSTFYLYGVAALGTTPVIVPYATGGDTIMTDGSYWYHTFVSSGTFTPQKALTCDYLVVAGGGGGGSSAGGGGGAGGLRSTVTATGGGGSLETALSLTTTGYTVTVGAGGVGATGTPTDSVSGNNSVFSTITSVGGGRGGSHPNGGTDAGTGGSGGGARFSGNTTPGLGTANQGYAGGNGLNSGNPFSGGGGGGAGAVGANAAYSVGGNGGNGVATSISGSSVTYGGGGGGEVNGTTAGTGGTGGGGAGAIQPANGTSGTANTGGGGGGGASAGTGGSGIVIVRYAV